MKYILLFVPVIFLLNSCSERDQDKRTASAIYKEREYLLKEFKDKSIRGRGRAIYELCYYKGGLINSFGLTERMTL